MSPLPEWRNFDYWGYGWNWVQHLPSPHVILCSVPPTVSFPVLLRFGMFSRSFPLESVIVTESGMLTVGTAVRSPFEGVVGAEADCPTLSGRRSVPLGVPGPGGENWDPNCEADADRWCPDCCSVGGRFKDKDVIFSGSESLRNGTSVGDVDTACAEGNCRLAEKISSWCSIKSSRIWKRNRQLFVGYESGECCSPHRVSNTRIVLIRPWAPMQPLYHPKKMSSQAFPLARLGK